MRPRDSRSGGLPSTKAAADVGVGARGGGLDRDRAALARRLACRGAAGDRRKARWHLPCLHHGLKAVPREPRRARDSGARLVVQLEVIATTAGLKDHDRWLTARTLLARKLAGRRATSRMPALLDYVLSRPIVSAGMIAEELRIMPRAAQDLVGAIE